MSCKHTHLSGRVSMWLNCFQEKSAERSLLFPHSSDMKPTLISVLVMIFTLCGTRAQTVTQPEDHISVFERSPVQVKCNYSYSGSPVLFWYVQYPKQHLQLLLKHISRESIRGFTAHLDKKEASFHLKKPSAQEEDSAVYYCALRGYQKLVFGTGTQLLIIPNIKNPDPAVYQLKGPKSNNISVCLYTDFQMNTTKDSEPAVFSLSRTVFNSNTTVLDMGALGSKSNGLVAWSKSTDFECQSTFQQEFYPNSGISCDAKLVEKSFETGHQEQESPPIPRSLAPSPPAPPHGPSPRSPSNKVPALSAPLERRLSPPVWPLH